LILDSVESFGRATEESQVRTAIFALATAVAAVGLLRTVPALAQAESLDAAMMSAYSNNPTLNAERARARVTDESVPQALAEFRPALSGSAGVNRGFSENTGFAPAPSASISLDVSQDIFTGFRNLNGVRSAETAVLSARESLRGAEQNTLLAAATAFMNLVQAQATLNLRNANVEFLRQQFRAAQDRLSAGTGTRTDVASAEANLAAAQFQVDQAVSVLNTAIAVYEQVIGHRPRSLGSARSVEPLLPRTLNQALDTGFASHPSIKIAEYSVDTADFAVKGAEGALLPSISASAEVSRSVTTTGTTNTSGTLSVGMNIPLWGGGAPSSRVRAAKETLGQRRIELDAAREQVRQAVTSAWGALDAARASIRSADAAVAAQQLVVSGFMEQLRVGQATTIDLLDAQQDLLTAQVAQVTAQRDRVVAGYTLLAAIGRLSARNLGLPVDEYDPTEHYNLVRDKLHGIRTPDGR
jgi:outer membrane protein